MCVNEAFADLIQVTSISPGIGAVGVGGDGWGMGRVCFILHPNIHSLSDSSWTPHVTQLTSSLGFKYL